MSSAEGLGHSPDAPATAAAPGIYPGPGSATGLRYWNGHAWDPRPVARTWTRVWCNVIDNILASILWFILVAIIVIPLTLSGAPISDGLSSLISISTLIVAYVGYFAVGYRLWGRTPGMMLGRLYVVHLPSGETKLSWGTSIGRAMGLVLGYACGILALVWLVTTASSRTKQGPHDSWAHTGVLTDPPAPPVNPYAVSGSAASLAATRTPVSGTPVATPPVVTPPASSPQAPEPVRTPPASASAPGTDAPRPTSTHAVPNPAEPARGGTPPAGPAALSGTQEAIAWEADKDAPITSAAPRSRKRLWLQLGLVAAGVALLAGAAAGALYIDSRIRANTLEQLLTATDASEDALSDYYYDERWDTLADELNRVKNTSNQSEFYYQEGWRIFIDGTRETANSHVTPVQSAILDVEAVQPLPWHSDITEARDAYLDHANAWLEAITRRTQHTASEESIPGLNENLDAEISLTWTVAQRRFEDISILWMPRALDLEIERIF